MIKIIIDSREQTPWAFDPSKVKTTVHKLEAGDYAIEGDEGLFSIERKSMNDFLGTISSGWERFLRELGRMEGSGHVARVIIIEGDFIHIAFTVDSETGDICSPDHNHHSLAPAFIFKRIAELTLMNVSVLFCACHEMSAAMATSLFIQRSRDIIDKG